MIASLRHIHARRKILAEKLDVFSDFEAWEETCAPSYCHPNLAAAYVSWWRLFAAVELARRFVEWGAVLDFGASVGELAHLLPEEAAPYEFIEQDERPARFLMETHPGALRRTLDSAPDGGYACVFALDALEHNDDYPELIGRLGDKLSPRGVLIISGPTESLLYRLGRRVAGFDSHYHMTDVAAIEKAASERLTRLGNATVPFAIPLFRLSAWGRGGSGGADEGFDRHPQEG